MSTKRFHRTEVFEGTTLVGINYNGRDALDNGFDVEARNGLLWINGDATMLLKDDVAELLPLLQSFVETGRFP